MPIIRKVIQIGKSKAVTIPRTWLEFYETETGEKIEKVTIEVNRVLTVAPLLKKKKVENPEKDVQQDECVYV